MTDYATSEDVLATFHQPPSGDAELARITSLLAAVTAQMHRVAHRDWLRHPATEYEDDEVWYANGDGTPTLHVHGGIVDITTIEVRYSASDDYEEVDETGWVLRGADPRSDDPPLDDEPWFHVVLTGTVVPSTWPRGPRSVRLTGVRGWDVPPADLVEAQVERVRQLYSSDASFSGAPVGGGDYGDPTTSLPRLPASFYAFLRADRERFWCHL